MSELLGGVLEPELDVLPRGRHRLSRERVRASQRARMLRAMVDAVAEKGYAATSVADVIGGAHASRETFYEQFANKRDCFLAAYDEAVRSLTQTMQDAAGTGDPPEQSFERVLAGYLDTLATEPALARTFLIEVYAAGPEAWARRAQVLEGFGEITYGLLREHPAIAALPDPRFAVLALVGAISAMVTGRLAAGEADSLPELRAPIVELLKALRPRGATAVTPARGDARRPQ